MSKILTLSPYGYSGRKAKSTRLQTLRLGPISIRVLSVFFLTMLALLYIAQSQSSATKGYEIKHLEDQKVEAFSYNEELSIKASKLRAIQKIDKEVSGLNLVPTTKYEYLK